MQEQTRSLFKFRSKLSAFFVVLALFVLSACASNANGRPNWMETPPNVKGSAVGGSSYEIFGEIKARDKAVMKALISLALQKGGRVDLESSVESRDVVRQHNSSESFSGQASVSTRAIVRGKEIPINAKIKAFWKDTIGKRIWVLVVED